MEMYGSHFTSAHVLNEKIARHMFDIMPENGPVMIIMDCDGSCWPSDSELFDKMPVTDEFIQMACQRIDDGSEPVITQVADYTVVASQLLTDKTNCGYVIIVFPHHSPESAMLNVDLIEMILNQVNLVARLIEKNGLLYELQMKQHEVFKNQMPLSIG